MNGAPDLSWREMLAAVALAAAPLAASLLLRLSGDIAVAGVRMVVQLGLAGIFLEVLFRWNNPFLNVLWLVVMIAVAAGSVCRNSGLRWRMMLAPVFGATAIAAIGVVAYFNAFVVPVADLFEARYLVTIGGMLLGNTMSGGIVALTHFFEGARAHAGGYRYHLACGATRDEALRPLTREALRRALRPMIASMMTIGIVSLPGMMTGQILGGSPPIVAIKYQIAIMFAILAALTLGVVLALRFASAAAFDRWGMIRPGVFGRDVRG